MSQLYYGDTPLSQMPASYPASRVTHESVSVTADGVKDMTALLSDLYALIDFSKINTRTTAKFVNTGNNNDNYQIMFNSSSQIVLCCNVNVNGSVTHASMNLNGANSTYYLNNTNQSTFNPPAGSKITLYYD